MKKLTMGESGTMAESDKYNHAFTIEETDVQKGETSHAKLLQMVPPGSTVLECGPAYGIMTRYLKEKLGCKVYILEVDPDCYANTIQYADGGVCTDLEEDDWLTRFDEGSFDCILYADVLEHLRNPQLVLSKMRRLLKPDGSVLLSVPNAANGDIIMNLLCDRFHYTPLGLLDNTHIHLFAREDLRTMVQEAGYYLAYESCTLTPLFCNEQGVFLSQEERLRLSWVLAGHSTRNVYQFICRLVTTETETQTDMGIVDNITIPSEARLFLEIGAEFTKALAASNDREQALRCEIENQRRAYKGELEQQRNDLMQQKEELRLDLTQQKEELIRDFEQEKEVLIKDFEQEKEALRRNLAQQKEDLKEDLTKQCEEVRRDLTQQCEALRERLVQAQHDYSVISNAFFWKVTKPLRVILDMIKYPFRRLQ